MRTQGLDAAQPMRILQAVLDVNEHQPSQVLYLLRQAYPSLTNLRVLVLGLAFKADTDDVRESASGRILADLASAGCRIWAHDPIAMANARRAWPTILAEYVEDWRGVVASVDAIIVATKWPEYQSLSEQVTGGAMTTKTIVDARRMFEPVDFAGSRYFTIGFNPQTIKAS
jgi:UDPglucose 6-dehydrogenase/GDP-mannose 6-dehydrogenase